MLARGRAIRYSQYMNAVVKTLIILALAAIAAVAQPKQIRVGGNVQQANLVQKVAPSYPVAMKAQGLEATVLLNVVISSEGVPTAISIHLHQGHHQHFSQKIAVMQVLDIQGCSCSGLAAVGEAHQLRRSILATG